jgi:hypothetical protein
MFGGTLEQSSWLSAPAVTESHARRAALTGDSDGSHIAHRNSSRKKAKSSKTGWNLLIFGRNSIEFCRNSIEFCRDSIEFCRDPIEFCRDSIEFCRDSIEFCRDSIEFCRDSIKFRSRLNRVRSRLNQVWLWFNRARSWFNRVLSRLNRDRGSNTDADDQAVTQHLECAGRAKRRRRSGSTIERFASVIQSGVSR